ncbi:MAG: ankyrin repeat domain-containing protein [Rhodocyclaceae bacterium]|nr:ankyrin repeat domain-containing protein [Rhodocyclaceae bacterium]
MRSFAVRVAACCALALATVGPVRAQQLPDPTRFSVRLEMGGLNEARAWLDAGLPPDFAGDRIGNGLMIGAWTGNIPLMELFLSRGADINAANRNNETALMHAAWRGQVDAVRWLMEHGATLERPPRQWNALHYAVFAGHAQVVRYLLERGANIDALTNNGSSVLMLAIYEGHDDLAKSLLDAGASTAAKNDWGDGALEWAMRYDRINIARLVTTKEQFAAAAARSKASWGEGARSEPVPEDIAQLLRVREILQSRGLAVDKIDDQIAAARARHARARATPQSAPAALEIRARRKAPKDQEMRLVPGRKPRADSSTR